MGSNLAPRLMPVQRKLTPCCSDLFRTWAPPEPDPALVPPAPANGPDWLMDILTGKPSDDAVFMTELQPVPTAVLPFPEGAAGAGAFFILRKRNRRPWGESTPALLVWIHEQPLPSDEVQVWNIDRNLTCSRTARRFTYDEVRGNSRPGMTPWVLTPLGQPLTRVFL